MGHFYGSLPPVDVMMDALRPLANEYGFQITYDTDERGNGRYTLTESLTQ